MKPKMYVIYISLGAAMQILVHLGRLNFSKFMIEKILTPLGNFFPSAFQQQYCYNVVLQRVVTVVQRCYYIVVILFCKTNEKLNQEYLDDDQVNPAYFFDDDTDANTKLCMDLFAKEMSFREYR